MAYKLSEHLYLQVEPTVENTSLGTSKVIRHITGVTAMKNFNGFTQEIDVQTGDTIDYVLNQSLKKETIPLDLIFNTYHTADGKEISAYSNWNDFRKWVAIYSDLSRYKMTLIMGYGNGNSSNDTPYDPDTADSNSAMFGRRIDIYIASMGTDTVLLSGGSLKVTVNIQCLSRPYTEFLKNQTTVSSSGTKVYEYVYPYTYGGTELTNNEIKNSFMKDIPIKIHIYGPPDGSDGNPTTIVDPIITLHYENQDNTAGDLYAEIAFSGISITKGTDLIVDANRYSVYTKTGDTIRNVYDLTDKANKSFLFAKPGASIITMTHSGSAGNWTMDVEYTEYDF